MTNDYSDFIDSAPDTAGLAQLSDLATDLYLAELAAAEAAEKAKEAQAKVTHISERLIPELMASLGMAEFVTTNGIKLKIDDVYRASIPKARREEAHAWLEANGEGGMVKHNVVANFARDQQEEARALRAQLEADGLNVSDEQKVESSTLRAWVKRQLEAGAEIPMDLFGAGKIERAKIKAKPESMFGE